MNLQAPCDGRSLADLPEQYRLILCDVWGCIHDGVQVFPDARALLGRWKAQGRIVLLLTNAPRPADPVRRQLAGLGLERAAYDEVITSGDAGLAELRAAGIDSAGFIGTAADRAVWSGTGLRLLEGVDADRVVCTGLGDGRTTAEQYDPELTAMRRRDATLLCFNPDRVVLRGGVAEACAGAIADRYEAMGGRVRWYGKPYGPVYERALAVAAQIAGRSIDRAEVVAVGDGLATDYLGAALAGFKFVFVTQGIEGDRVAAEGAEPLLTRFARAHGVAPDAPLAVVPRLA
jgi:HAD superfamily hydrolase (TIGR01459 family)